MIIEDETTLRESLVRGLSRQAGLHVQGAETLDEALRLIDEERPDLIISDLDLPGRSGIELIGELGHRRMSVPVIFVSAYVQAFGAQIPRHAGVEVLEKPVPLERLRHVVQSYLGRQRTVERAPFGVAEYLQMACYGRHSVEIAVDDAPDTIGRVIVHRGQLWTAEDERGEGVDAFARLALASGLGVTCTTLDRAPGPRLIHEPWEALLLDSVRRFDEGSRESGAAPPAPPAELPSTTAPDQGEVDELLDEGMEALLAKNYARALFYFEEAERLAPGHRVVRANIARLMEMGITRGGET